MGKFSDTLSGRGRAGSDLRLGLDVGDRQSPWAAMNLGTGEVREGGMVTTPEGVEECFGELHGCIVLMEAGTHSHWLAPKLRAGAGRAFVNSFGFRSFLHFTSLSSVRLRFPSLRRRADDVREP